MRAGRSRASIADNTTRWLAGVSLPCSDPTGLAETGRSVSRLAGPHFHWRVNLYDSDTSACAPWARGAYVHVSHQRGYMTLFWKRVLVPSLTSRYDRIFILDSDVRLSPQLGFSPAAVDAWFAQTGAMIVTPSIIAHGAGPAARSGTGLRNHHPYTAECAASLIGAPERLHISRPEAYEVLWRVLESVPDHRLSTDTMLMALWAKLTCEAFPRRPPCVLVNSIAVVHLNTKTIHKAGLDPQYSHPKAKKNNVLFYLWDHPLYASLVNGSVDPYPANGCGVITNSLADLGLGWDGKPVTHPKKMSKARKGAAATSASKPTCFPLLDDPPQQRDAGAITV